ncbi:MAG: dephospho-CoA kinase [Sedimentibacter sp.]
MMQNKRVIVITGSIGTGKSTAVDILKKLGFKVLDSDKIVHEGYNKDNVLYKNVLGCFGKEILNHDETINRQKLGSIVFNHEESLKRLNKITHSYVVDALMNGVEESSEEVIFLDIPLFLENISKDKEYSLKYDEIWLVYVSPETQIERLTHRAIKENKNIKDVLNIINKQIPIEEKVLMVDEVIDNEGTVEELEIKIKDILEKKDIGW